ncbi:iron chelate uptake ABC transporter family permease subunit [Rhizobium sp. SSA_523]|uniref:iron chelate uptake ABC transporter family permease subunit n=1 Tax=Rhizobium sp. SSA_523 TaxID=2952477 RepID=UPI002091D65D|nr:iron chelate uptake ABC transporter family permease subunit [Rhizobium sp. SSA_523]MCO5733126.1 iron chelate uptake ABC transporter family permease subunit [Rhizobium sp. SSA_523]WKC24000.1 iron chelate uptake ABC transporter family permease subunit [Rhizobium sp. SSA_523]
MRDRLILAGLIALAAAAILAFLTVNLRGHLAFALELRGVRLAALMTVALAIGLSTVVFQTITGNRILTPSIMGLDALYQFGQTGLVFTLGGLGYVSLSPQLKFTVGAAALMLLAILILWPALKRRMDLSLMLLAGIVIGGLFRSLTNLLARLIDPQEFAVAQRAMVANFAAPHTDLLLIAAAVTLVVGGFLFVRRHQLDVVALGQDSAIALGIDWNRVVMIHLLCVSLLVAVSTALVGPVTFFGLLIAALAERLTPSRRHARIFLVAFLCGVIVLVGGQTLLQHGLGQASTLSVVVDFIGGLVFILLLFGRHRR